MGFQEISKRGTEANTPVGCLYSMELVFLGLSAGTSILIISMASGVLLAMYAIDVL